MRVFIAVISLAAVASAGSLNFTKCDAGEKGEIVDVSCEQIGDYEDVIVERGHTYDFTIKFTAGEDSMYLVPEIYGVISGMQVPWQGVPASACSSLVGNKCPIVSGQAYSYSVSVEILSSYPAVSLTFLWSLVSADENANKGNKEICFSMPARIV